MDGPKLIPQAAVTPSGFTLIEILIALFILAVVSTTLMTTASQNVVQTGLLRDKTIAHWVALNEMSRLRSNIRLQENYPQTGTSQSEVNMLNKDWLVEVVVEATQNENVRRVSVDVFRDEFDQEEDYAMITLVSFVGRY